jgi:hypothetical protein
MRLQKLGARYRSSAPDLEFLPRSGLVAAIECKMTVAKSNMKPLDI